MAPRPPTKPTEVISSFSLKLDEKERAYWADDERETSDAIVLRRTCHANQERNRGDVVARKAAVQQDDVLGGRPSRSLTMLPYVEPYNFTRNGTPGVVKESLKAGDACEDNWPVPAGNHGTIEQLAEHRESHHVRLIHVAGYKRWADFWMQSAESVKKEHEKNVSRERDERGTLFERMSREGATTREWRCLALNSYAYGRGAKGRWAIGQARKCAYDENDFAGAERQSPQDVRRQLFQAVTDVYHKYGVSAPPERQAPGDVVKAEGGRCRWCHGSNGRLLDCIGFHPCSVCAQLRIKCEPRKKPAPARRDELRLAVLNKAALEHLQPESTWAIM